jgi:hypothetical protein
MYMRLGFAVAANLAPDILLLDEIFAVGDADFQQRCIKTIQSFLEQGKTILFVSHSPAAIRAICRRVCVLDHGELTFDGSPEGGLRFYDRLLNPSIGSTRGSSITADQVASVAGFPDQLPEVAAEPGSSDELASWLIDLLRKAGLKPYHDLLAVGCAAAQSAGHVRAFIGDNRCAVENCPVQGAFGTSRTTRVFDYAVASSLFSTMPFNSVASCIASVVARLKPTGAFYATWFENPDPANFEPITHRTGIVTYADRAPYHYPFLLIQHLCDTLGAEVERVASSPHPGGESVLRIARRA